MENERQKRYSTDVLLAEFFAQDDLKALAVDAGALLECPLLVLDDTFHVGTFTNCCRLMELHFTDALTSIDDEENFYGCDNLTIYGPADSYIESFAKEYGIPFVVE